MLMTYPEEKNLNDRARSAIRLFHEIAQATAGNAWKTAFLSGFAIDAHFGYLTRNHRDVDIIISPDEAKLLASHLTKLGHEIYESPRSKGECLKVDHADPENPSQTYGDIHYFWEDAGKVTIPLHGRKLVFSGSFAHITEERELLGEKILVLKPEYLLEEKIGWCDQVGLISKMEKERLEAYRTDMAKIAFLMNTDRNGQSQ